MAKVSLAVRRANEERQAQTLGALISDIGETLGNYSADSEMTKSDTRATIEEYLTVAMKEHGLQVEMLKAPSKTNPGELWTILVDAINAPRVACDLPELSTGTRDNYLSRIRAFVRDRGAMPLDLFGNLAVKKAKVAAEQVASEQAVSEETNSTSEELPEVSAAVIADKPTVMNAKGLIALRDFLALFIEQNDEPEASADMEFVLGAADELLQATKKIIAKKGKSK